MTSDVKAKPLWQWSAVDLSAAIAKGEVSSKDAVSSCIERVRQTNGYINAIVDDLTEDALHAAEKCDQQLKDGGPVGALHGVPVTIKENVDQKGRATPNGVAAFKDIIAPDDAPVVRNLKNAGAIPIGRTNTPEFSFRATTANALHGETLNPWDHAKSPGGSSGGASAACLSGYAPINHGNDIGGSLRFPAFACGLATIRPTLGRVPAYNPSQSAERPALAQMMSVQGTIAREVKDVRLGTKVMSARDSRDPWWVPAPFDWPKSDEKIKVALTKDTLGYDMHPSVHSALDQAAEILEKAGYIVEETNPPHMDIIPRRWMRNTMGEMDHLIGDAIRGAGSEIINRIIDDYHVLYDGISSPAEFMENLADRSRLLRDWLTFLEEYPLVLTPFMMRPLFDLQEDAKGRDEVHDIFRASQYSFTMNYLGLPAAMIPVSMHEGLPMSVQIVGQRFREDMCLDAIQAIEDSVGVMAERYYEREGL